MTASSVQDCISEAMKEKVKDQASEWPGLQCSGKNSQYKLRAADNHRSGPRRAPSCATWSLFPFISACSCPSLTLCFQNNLSPASQSISHHSVMSSQKAQVGHICTLSLCLLLNVVYLFFEKLEFGPTEAIWVDM